MRFCGTLPLCSGTGAVIKKGDTLTGQACWMSALGFLTGDNLSNPSSGDWSWRDDPECVCPGLRVVCFSINDWLPDSHRSRVISPYLFDPLGTNLPKYDIERLRSLTSKSLELLEEQDEDPSRLSRISEHFNATVHRAEENYAYYMTGSVVSKPSSRVDCMGDLFSEVVQEVKRGFYRIARVTPHDDEFGDDDLTDVGQARITELYELFLKKVIRPTCEAGAKKSVEFKRTEAELRALLGGGLSLS